MVFIKRDRIYETMVLRHRTTGAQDSDPQRTGHNEGSPTVAQERKPRWGRPECKKTKLRRITCHLAIWNEQANELTERRTVCFLMTSGHHHEDHGEELESLLPHTPKPKVQAWPHNDFWFPLFLTDHCPLPTSAPRWCTSQHSYSLPHLPFFQFPNSMAQGEGGGLRARPTGSRRKPRALLGHLC